MSETSLGSRLMLAGVQLYYNQTLDLEDWLLPVVHQNQPVTLKTRAMTVEELARWHERNAKSLQPIATELWLCGT